MAREAVVVVVVVVGERRRRRWGRRRGGRAGGRVGFSLAVAARAPHRLPFAFALPPVAPSHTHALSSSAFLFRPCRCCREVGRVAQRERAQRGGTERGRGDSVGAVLWAERRRKGVVVERGGSGRSPHLLLD